jgi:probable F420-dependent oxidoreductase
MSSSRGIVVLGGDLTTLAEVAVAAEQAGLDSVWTTEFYERSAMISLATLAHATDRVTIGSAIAYAVGRSPLVLATEARDVDELAGGRLVLGLGTGTRTMQRDWHGETGEAPAPRMEELVPLLRAFWSMDAQGIAHEGRFYQVRLKPTADIRPPVREDIPVYMAGVNPRMIRAAGSVADGLVGHPVFTPRYVTEVVRPALEDGATRAGRAPTDVALAGYVICSVHDDATIAREEARAQIAFYSVVRTYASIFELHGLEGHADAARRAWKRGDREAMIAAIPDAMIDLMACAGTLEDVRDQYEDRFAKLYDHSLLYSPSFALDPGRFRENLHAIIAAFAPARKTVAAEPEVGT